MGAKKIGVLILLIGVMFSCDNTVSTQEYNEVKGENANLINSLNRVKEEKEEAIKRDIENNKIIDDAIQELSEISNSSNTIRIKMMKESNSINDPTQTERLSDQIKSIKDRLENYKNVVSPQLISRIESLQKLVTAKDNEINQLKDDIENKNIEIRNQNVTIKEQVTTIEQKEQQVVIKDKALADL